MTKPNKEMEHSEDDSRGAVFMVQPEEVPQYKALRRIVDKVFLARDQFLLSSVNYLSMSYGDEGVNRQLRSMLFRPPRRLRRGVRRSEVLGTGTGEMDVNGNSLSAVKQTQRQSKQKERCENRLMSLLFATIYDPATKQCRLVQGAPPLKLRRQDKNGLFRNVSNYTDVRMYLRNSMASILSGHTEGVKSVVQMIPAIYKLLPLLFILIGRTFFLMLSCENKSIGPATTDGDPPQLHDQKEAMKVLDDCMSAIQDYITTWERRNFTTDNRLTSSLEAGVTNECYISIRDLLASMIAVIAPQGDEPYEQESRKLALYGFGLHHGFKCNFNEADDCLLGTMCPGGANGNCNRSLGDSCLKYMAALDTCASMAASVDIPSFDQSLNCSDFPLVLWDNSCATTTLHRLNNLSMVVKDRLEHRPNASDDLFNIFVQQTRTDIARCWGAFGRSNSHAASILATLEIKSASEMRATVTELIFGGGIAATALFEREKEIIPICAKLRSKKGPQLVMMNEDDSDEEKEVVDKGGEDNQQSKEQLAATNDGESLNVMEETPEDEGYGGGEKRNPAERIHEVKKPHAERTEGEIGKPAAQFDHRSNSHEVLELGDAGAMSAEESRNGARNSGGDAEDGTGVKEARADEIGSSRKDVDIADRNEALRKVDSNTGPKKLQAEVSQGRRYLPKRGSGPPSNSTRNHAEGSPKETRLRQLARKKRRRSHVIQTPEGGKGNKSVSLRRTKKRK